MTTKSQQLHGGDYRVVNRRDGAVIDDMLPYADAVAVASACAKNCRGVDPVIVRAFGENGERLLPDDHYQ